jgi:glycosyltransferase involved in cell wall biosynthesis
MRFSGLISVKLITWLHRNIRKFNFAHLHTARDLVPMSAGRLIHKAGVPYATQTHGMILPDARRKARVFDKLLTLGVLRNAGTRFVLTDHENRSMAQLLGTRSATVRLPNGISVERPERVSGRPLDVLFLGRLHPRKQVMDFAHAARDLIRDGYHDVRFSVVGPDDGDRANLLSFIKAHPELSGRLVYEGPIPHDEALSRLARAGIFVLPSINEPFPMTLLEALAVGTPSICTVSCGVAEDLTEADAALVIEPGAGPLAAALRTLIDDDERRGALSRTAVETVRTRYSMQAVGSQLLDVYAQKG